MKTKTSVWHLIGAITATLFGVASFFFIVGVFGLPASIIALVLFMALALLIFQCPQVEESQS
jgi:uncharacterized membrane protein YuzA (DUF378 family)